MSTNGSAVSCDEVAQVVRRILEERAINAAVSPDCDLRDAGLTSLDMVALVLAVEAEFNVTLPETQITPANFRSISSINALVGSLRA